MHDNIRGSFRRRFWWLAIAALAVGAFSWINHEPETLSLSAFAAPPSSEKRPAHVGGEDHSQKEAALRRVMSGTVDIYFDLAEIESAKPTLSGVRFVDLVDVTGKELLRFEKSSTEQWLVDPDMILTFRLRPTSTKKNSKKK